MKSVVRIFALCVLAFLSACNNNKGVSGTNISETFLPVEQAFQFSSQQMDANTVKLSWKIAEGYHLYKNKFEFTLQPETARISDVQLPQGNMIDDLTFGKQEAYKHQVDVLIKLKSDGADEALKLSVKYQGCSEKGLCYPPEKRVISIKL